MKNLLRSFLTLLIGFSLGAVLLTGCNPAPRAVSLSSGVSGGGYQRLGEQIKNSALVASNLALDNRESKGSIDNLQRLLDKQVDFALTQLDVASEAMKEGKVQAMVVLANEYLHLITLDTLGIKSVSDLQGKRLAIGASGSGINFTSTRILASTDLNLQQEAIGLDDGFEQLRARKVDGIIYVGPLGTNLKLREQISKTPGAKLIPVQPSLMSYLTIQFPESYRTAQIPAGTYNPLPAIPTEDLPTLSTATAIVTRPDVDREKVALMTWAILSTSRQYAPFYPQLSVGDAKSLLQAGLVYVHPGAQQAFDQGDPRVAWIKYLQENKPLQAATIMFSATTLLGFMIRRWRKRKATAVLKASRKSVGELRQLMDTDAEAALKNLEDLRQKQRLMLLDGSIPPDVYDQVDRMAQLLAEQCRSVLRQSQQKSVQSALALLDESQAKLQGEQTSETSTLVELEKTAREMLKTEQINLPTYLQLRSLILSLSRFSVS